MFLVMVNSFNSFHLGKASSVFLKDSLAEDGILGWQFCSFNIWNIPPNSSWSDVASGWKVPLTALFFRLGSRVFSEVG